MKQKFFSTTLKKLSALWITVLSLLWLFILTLWGTIAQVEHGLYVAQERFFHSLFFSVLGRVPLPGARLILWILFINLACVTITRFSKYRKWRYTGLLTIHFGLLLYFVAAFVTFHGSQESYVHLPEGGATNVARSYHQWEVAFWKDPASPYQVTAVAAEHFSPGHLVEIPPLNISLYIDTYYPNADAFTGTLPDARNPPINGSGITFLRPVAVDKEREKNVAGMTFRLRDTSGHEQAYLLFGSEQQPTPIRINGEAYFVQLRHRRYPLPFTITLKDFRAKFHPGTETARSFESDVEIQTHDLKRKVRIQMNEPLRYKDFTFYQASYAIDGSGGEYSTFAVVQNAGRLLPYIASFVTFGGLVVHFLTASFAARRKS